jgi:hypothetical protein
MATRRFKSATMKFGVPLSVPGSRYVERCYGFHGAAYAHPAPDGAAVDLILINDQRQLLTVWGMRSRAYGYRTDAVGRNDGWRMLGWRMADGSMPLGAHDAVDPELAQFEYLPLPNPDGSCGDASPRQSTARPIDPVGVGSCTSE